MYSGSRTFRRLSLRFSSPVSRFELLYGIFVVGYGSAPILSFISFSFFFSLFSRLSFCLLATPIPRTASPSLPPISRRCSPFLIIIFSPTPLYLLCVLYTCCSGLLSIPRSFPLDGYNFSACEQTLSVHFPINTRLRKRLYIGCKELVYVVLQVVRIYRLVRCDYILVQGQYIGNSTSWQLSLTLLQRNARGRAIWRFLARRGR